MNTYLRLLIMLLFASNLLPGCGKRNGGSPSGPGFASGRVTNLQGQPLKGAEIIVSNVFNYRKTLKAVTGENGQYSIALPADPESGDFTVSGNYTITHHGREYILELEGDARIPFSTSKGAVVNFVLKQTGRQPPGGPGAPGCFFGGVISCYPGDGADMSKVTITAKPLQPLIDGSIAPVQILRPEPDADLSWVINLPLGLYEISAREGNAMLYLRDYTENIPDANVSTLVRGFERCPVNVARYWIKLDVLKNQ